MLHTEKSNYKAQNQGSNPELLKESQDILGRKKIHKITNCIRMLALHNYQCSLYAKYLMCGLLDDLHNMETILINVAVNYLMASFGTFQRWARNKHYPVDIAENDHVILPHS